MLTNNAEIVQSLQNIVDCLESDQWFRRLDTAHTQIYSALCTVTEYVKETGDNDALDLAQGLAHDKRLLQGLIEKEEMRFHNGES